MMKTTTYTVAGKSGANLRLLPSSASELVATLKHGAECTVVSDFTSTNTNGGETTKYLCVLHGGKYLWAAAQNLTMEHKDYQTALYNAAKKTYPECIGCVHSGENVAKVVSLETERKYKANSCNRQASIALHEAGLLPVGCIVAHTPKRDGKKCIKDAVTGLENLKHCKALWVNKPYHNLPDELRAPGIVYIYNSNAAISGKDEHIFSCNKSKGYRYEDKEDYDRTSGYPFTSNILVVIVPNK